MKYSKVSGVVRWSGGTTVLGVGMSADADHPLVLERPDLFGDDAPPPMLPGPARSRGETPPGVPAAPKVEQATRAPGEKRGGSGRG